MQDLILQHLNEPAYLEALYREHRNNFKKAFLGLYAQISEHPVAQCWYARLHDDSEELHWGWKQEWLVVAALALLAGAIAKLPAWLAIQPENFYPRYAGFMVFPFLMGYYMWKRQIAFSKLIWPWVICAISLVYMNLLPGDVKKDTFLLACIYLPVLLWAMLGVVFMQGRWRAQQDRFLYLQYNGDLAVMIQLILAAGAMFTALTFALFSLIQVRIEEVYAEYVGIWGLAATPLVASCLIEANPLLVRRISPIIASIFAPFTLVTLTGYLIALLFIGKSPYNDRHFLLVFNLILVGVMAILFFSIISIASTSHQIFLWVLLGLSLVTILFCGTALSAILFRIIKWGVTPNRLAVLGIDLLMGIHLLLIAYRLSRAMIHKQPVDTVIHSITSFLPVYVIWAALVVFLFPVLFHFQ
ncbi:MAG: hypothetical protein IRZ29_06295 [Thermoflavifilum sp.]|nr:hypothetical protein [Thermoflavifilum sp.]